MIDEKGLDISGARFRNRDVKEGWKKVSALEARETKKPSRETKKPLAKPIPARD